MDDEHIQGVAATIRALEKMRETDQTTIAEGLQVGGELVLDRASYYCPVRTAVLVGTGEVNTTGRGFGARVYVSFGGPIAPYAIYVHERYDQYHTPPTCAKFLERAVREVGRDLADLIGRKLKGQTSVYEAGERIHRTPEETFP